MPRIPKPCHAGPWVRSSAVGLALLAILFAVSCGGGGGSGGSGQSVTPPPPPTSNVVSVVVDAGPLPATNPSVNTLYTTVTICVPGSTTECQTIDHIQVDTGSYGFRVLAPVLTLNLTPTTIASDGSVLAECTQFADGYSWGPVASADIQIAGESAASVPIQVIGPLNFAPVPSNCSGTGKAEDTVAAFGANGILGIGPFEQDCGSGCTVPNSNGYYYSCLGTTCVDAAVALNSQVANPVRLFAADNDGTILDLPAVAAPGAVTLTGSLIFGIDTQTNNASGTETLLALDANGNFTTVFNGQTLSASFLDSGTNGLFFNNSTLTPCPSPNFTGFYCPPLAQAFSATLAGTNPGSTSVAFTVDNAQLVGTNNPTFTVLPTLAGTFPGTTATFDWGLPFFYGRRVATAIENQRTAVGTGPYVAF